jgi:hypothetical protein
MIAFGVAIGNEQNYERWAGPSIRSRCEPDSVILERRGASSIQEPYNSILDEACRLPDLEAVVLIHDDAELDDPCMLAKIRSGFADPQIAVIGPIGGRAIDSIAWWEGATFGRVVAPGVSLDTWAYTGTPYGWHHVEIVDGLMMVLSPWAAREVRFDERFTPYFHGYDIDYCFQVRSRGRGCLVAPIAATHHGVWRPSRSREWIEASIVWQRKWGLGGILPRPAALAWA